MILQIDFLRSTFEKVVKQVQLQTWKMDYVGQSL